MLANKPWLVHACFVTGDKLLHNKPRFYKEPSQDDIEANGSEMATIHARARARIIGSRVLSATVAFGIGIAMTAQEYLANGKVEPADCIANFGLPAIFNGLAQIKVERQLNHTEQELAEILPDILDTRDDFGDTAHPPS